MSTSSTSNKQNDKQKTWLRRHVGQTAVNLMTGALGASLILLLFYTIMPRMITPTPVVSTPQKFSVYTWHGEAKPDDASWRLAIRDMVDTESLRMETRLRDHFTLLLALAGISTALILGLFSLSQSRREEKATEELREIKHEATELLKEAQEKLEKIRSYEEKMREHCNQSSLAYLSTNDIPLKSSSGKTLSESNIDGSAQDSPEKGTDNAEITQEVTVVHPVSKQELSDDPKDMHIDGIGRIDSTHIQCNTSIELDFKKCCAAAIAGDADAQANLGVMYYAGKYVTKDVTESIRWLRKAAAKGNARAQSSLGAIYRSGIDSEKNISEAIRWYHMAAEQGYVQAQSSLSSMYFDGEGGIEKNYKQAVYWSSLAADQGEKEAQLTLGLMYCNALGVMKDETQAAYWFRQAANQGNALAMICLAPLYSLGRGVEKSEAEASRWYLAAAFQGHPGGFMEMAQRYYKGLGVPENYEKAYVFLSLYQACDRFVKDEEMQELQKAILERLSSEQIARAQREATEIWDNIQKRPKDARIA